jgi:hypothetical protein
MATARLPLVSLVLVCASLGGGAWLSGCTSDPSGGAPEGDGGGADGATSPGDGGGGGGGTGDGGMADATTGSDGSPGDDGGASGDASSGDDGGGGDGGFSGPCPTGNHAGAIDNPDAVCLAFTPTITGASPLGENADEPHYALSPTSGANGKLVLFFNGTSAHPSDSIADATKNFYNAATSLGYQVLALSYHSIETVASQCSCAETCYFPTRESIIRGVYQTGAASDLQADGGIRLDEGIAGRTELALRWLAANDSTHAWASFLTSAAPSAPPETQIDWSKIVVAGHSQGGGHAAAVGKLFAVSRVIQLSATCDTVVPAVDCNRATGTAAEASPATWTTRTVGTWATPATSYWGLDAKTVLDDAGAWVSGDGNCFIHAEVWQNEQEPASQIDDDGGVCDASTSTENHNASIDCDENFPVWKVMLK